MFKTGLILYFRLSLNFKNTWMSPLFFSDYKIESSISITFPNRSSFIGIFSSFTKPLKYKLKVSAHVSSLVINFLPSVRVMLSFCCDLLEK